MTTEIDSSNPPIAAPKGFGEALREAREQAGFSIERAAMSTRISAAFIDALENQNFKVLPGEIFGRGFVRNLCRAYSCDAKALVAAYDLAVAGQLAEAAQEHQREREMKPKHIRYNEERRSSSSSFNSNGFSKNAAKAWNFALPAVLAVLVILGLVWVIPAIYQSWKGSDKSSDKLTETGVIQQPSTVAPAVVPAAPIAPAAVAVVPPEHQPILRGTGIETLDLVVKQPVMIRIGRDKDKKVNETFQPETYRFQFDEQLSLLVDDMSAVEIRFKGQVIPNKGIKGEKRYMTFAVSESTLAKKQEKPKL
ncbi:MAG: helix-turn-helix domain-containing protein [Chitinophagaceae bacterium]|nr:helix-turn-helix domain-containing protein [Oligoflexus sp.]